MIQSGNTVIMTFEELELFGQRLVVKTIERLKEDQTIPNVSVKLGIEDLINMWGVSRNTIYRWTRRKVKPLPLNDSRKIDLKIAEHWYNNERNTYQI